MKTITALSLTATLALLGGCATPTPIGGLYTDLALPLDATSVAGGSKVGVAECTSFLGLWATGDCSIDAAKAEGDIDEVTHVDWKANNVLGIIGNYTTTVYGN